MSLRKIFEEDVRAIFLDLDRLLLRLGLDGGCKSTAPLIAARRRTLNFPSAVKSHMHRLLGKERVYRLTRDLSTWAYWALFRG